MAEKTIELLSPAGDMERLRMSLAYGADAVYLAGPDFGMRSFAGNFTPEELRQAVELCHSRGVAVHVTCNTMPRNDEAARLPEWLEFLQAAGVDAAILADVGVLSLLKKHAPGVKAHISTQASVSNYQAAAAWYELGASRVILARSCPWTRSGRSGPRPLRRWSWRPSSTGPCASATRAAACCPTT